MTPPFPHLRFVALAWVAVYLPSYALAYGWLNFLFLCNLSVLLTALGIWLGSRVLLSSQALATLPVSTMWAADFLPRLLLGRHLFGGTEYMWDPRWPLFTRLLSLYHLLLPLVLLHALRRLGYDRRGLLLQSAIVIVGVVAGRFAGPEANINGAFRDPVFKLSFGPAPLHLAVVAGAMVLVVYPLIHLLLSRVLGPGPQRGSGSTSSSSSE